jgi:hypothetical protein
MRANVYLCISVNLDFEDIKNGLPGNRSIGHQQSGYSVALDSVNVKSGKYAIAIEFTENTIDYHAFTFRLPHNYDGKKITLSGYIKTEILFNVTNFSLIPFCCKKTFFHFMRLENSSFLYSFAARRFKLCNDLSFCLSFFCPVLPSA